MKIGVGLPGMIPGCDGQTHIRWAQVADTGPFSSLSTIDRVCFGNWEPLTALAGAAAVTQRVQLMPTILLAAVREPVMLAKQIATLDVLSAGRVVLGLGVGGRQDDFAATGQQYRNRGRRFEKIIETMRSVWRGEAVSGEAGPVGPMPVQTGGPPILIGAIAGPAIQRIGHYADGYIGTGGPDRIGAVTEIVKKAWQDAGRTGAPRLVATAYFALGAGAEEPGRSYIRGYYSSFMGPAADFIVQGLLTTAEAAKAAVKGYEDAGFDEITFWPTVAKLEQVERLAEAVA